MAEPITVTVEREIPFPPEKIWRALTQPHLMEEWLMKTDFKPQIGHSFTLRGDWGGVECEVLAIEPEKSLSYTWNHPHSDPAYALESVVVFTLTATATGTHLRVEQTGFSPEQKQAIGGAKWGWQENLANLEKLLAEGKG
ncbi:SRPBCC family protein [Pelagibacterium sp.]|uniref:SRPBCC family protein n=1 Tax=Pelagibacterium sp. TaxID=1967288 RepID=UPI003BACD6AA